MTPVFSRQLSQIAYLEVDSILHWLSQGVRELRHSDLGRSKAAIVRWQSVM